MEIAMSKIRIDTDSVRNVGHQFRVKGEHIFEIGRQLNHSINNLDTWAWSGRHRANLEPLLEQVYSKTDYLEKELQRLSQLLLRIADTFEQNDSTAAENLTELPWVDFSDTQEIFFPFPIFIPKYYDHSNRDKKRYLYECWESWTTDERLDFLKEVYGDLVKKYNLIPIEVKAEDLPDQKLWIFTISDGRGVYRGNEIVIDVDNLSGSNATQVLKTLIHETRHQIQAELVQRYKNEGEKMQLPPDVTLDQVKAWEQNMKQGNYIQPEDDFEGYRKQPIEKDARDFADDYFEEALPEPETHMA
jgi:uncharacterized protein YukE